MIEKIYILYNLYLFIIQYNMIIYILYRYLKTNTMDRVMFEKNTPKIIYKSKFNYCQGKYEKSFFVSYSSMSFALSSKLLDHFSIKNR